MAKTLQVDKMAKNKNKLSLKNMWNGIMGALYVGSPESIDKKQPTASWEFGGNAFRLPFDGEKDQGEIGPIRDYVMNYPLLRLRSWQSYVESEITQTVLNKYTAWVVGGGLKLKAQPVKRVLEAEGINLEAQEFNNITEARFNVWANSTDCDYADMVSLNKIAEETQLDSIIGGDVLIILRLIKGMPKVQIVDGAHVGDPNSTRDDFGSELGNGNIIRNGIEINTKGQHVAFWVAKRNFQFERVPARGKNGGMVMAFMIYGGKYRLDSVRGLPLIATVLETLKKLERYKEATVGSAEERQKIVMQIVHQQFSDGENPLQGMLAKIRDDNAVLDDIPEDSFGNKMADTVAVSTNKKVFNMPLGAELKALESKNELFFKEFYGVNIDIVCAALGIPPEVALSKYDSNFSSSRAALKDWEHTVLVNRKKFKEQFYQKVYNFWLEVEILKNKIQAPGYLQAKAAGNNTVIESYRNSRFIGANIPHIDPLKEVKAIREKLGEMGKNYPLITAEAATEELNSGDNNSNVEQYAEELNKADSLGIPSSSGSSAEEVVVEVEEVKK